MQLQVTAVTKEPRVFNNKTSWGVKDPAGAWYSLYRDEKPNKGDTFEVTVKENQGKNGQVYRDAFPVIAPNAHQVQATSNGNGKCSWEDCKAMSLAASKLAYVLEPDIPDINGGPFIDRSYSRIKFIDTVLMAFKDGKIALPKDEPPPPMDEDMPPWER